MGLRVTLSNSWLFFFFYGFLSEISKPTHLGGYGYWCLPGRYQETDASVYRKSAHYINKHIPIQKPACQQMSYLVPGFLCVSFHTHPPLYFPFPVVWTKWLLLCHRPQWICAAPPQSPAIGRPNNYTIIQSNKSFSFLGTVLSQLMSFQISDSG